MGEFRRSSEVRRVELVDAALHIIATQGIAALSTRRLAAQVGLSSGAIFRHFASLEALLEALVTRVEVVLEATYPERQLPPRERLERFIDARSAAVGAQVGILRLVVSEQFRLALPEGCSGRLELCVKRSRDFILSCLREGQASGEFREDIDADALATIVIGTIQTLASSASGTGPLHAEGGGVRDALLTILRSPEPRAQESRRRSP